MVGRLDEYSGLETPDAHAEVFKELTDSLKTSQVTEADFSSCGIGPVALGHLYDWVRDATAASVEVVILDGNPIGYPSLVTLKPGAATGIDVKKGVFAAINDRFGEVTMDPDSDAEVKLRWLDDGSESSYTKATQLTSVVASRTDLIEDYSHVQSLGEALSGSKVKRYGFANCNFNPVSLATFVKSVRWAEAVVTSINCLNNPLGEGVHTIVKVFEETPRLRTLCGLEEGVEQIDWSNSKKGPADVALLATELKAGRAVAAVASLRCGNNPAMVGELDQYGRLKTPDAHAEVFKELTDSVKTSQVTEADFSSCGIGPVALGHVSDWVREATAAPVEVVVLDGNPIGLPASGQEF
jgi:hypothetical protein